MINSLRYSVQDWKISDFTKFSLPDGLYCAAYILIMDAIWHYDSRIVKYIVLSFVPLITIGSEVFQYFGLVKGTFDIYDLVSYSIPPVIYLVMHLINKHHVQLIKSNKRMKKYCISVCVFALFVIGFTASDEEQNNSSNSSVETNEVSTDNLLSTTKVEGKKQKVLISKKPISRINDVEELRQAINNTVWTHTTKGDVWLRYEFVGNTVKQYGALPRSGEWRYDGESQFELSELRSESDGKRYIIATFTPTTESLAMFGTPVLFNFKDYHLYLNGQDMGGFIMADYEWD